MMSRGGVRPRQFAAEHSETARDQGANGDR